MLSANDEILTCTNFCPTLSWAATLSKRSPVRFATALTNLTADRDVRAECVDVLLEEMGEASELYRMVDVYAADFSGKRSLW